MSPAFPVWESFTLRVVESSLGIEFDSPGKLCASSPSTSVAHKYRETVFRLCLQTRLDRVAVTFCIKRYSPNSIYSVHIVSCHIRIFSHRFALYIWSWVIEGSIHINRYCIFGPTLYKGTFIGVYCMFCPMPYILNIGMYALHVWSRVMQGHTYMFYVGRMLISHPLLSFCSNLLWHYSFWFPRQFASAFCSM